MENKNITMEIIYSNEFNRANIKFSGIPDEEVRAEMKQAGWLFSRKNEVWYPTNKAQEESNEFAKKLQEKYFSEQTSNNSFNEPTGKQLINQMADSGMSLKEIVLELKNRFGEEEVQKAIDSLKIEPDSLAFREKSTGKYFAIQTSEENGYDWELFNSDFSVIDGGVYYDDLSPNFNKDDYTMSIYEFTKETMKSYGVNYDDCEPADYEEIQSRSFNVFKAKQEEKEVINSQPEEYFKENNLPYIHLYWSENPHFKGEDKYYSIKEFNELIEKLDKEFHNEKMRIKEKYGSYDRYIEIPEEELPLEDRNVNFGYDKTRFQFCNIPTVDHKDTITYEPDRFDIGDGNGNIFDFVRTTCTYPNVIEAINNLENELYFSSITGEQRNAMLSIINSAQEDLTQELVTKELALDEARPHYKEVHNSIIIEASKAEEAESRKEKALSDIKNTYDSAIEKILSESKANDIPAEYAINEVKSFLEKNLFEVSRNTELTKVDWERQREIWNLFPSNCNLTDNLTETYNNLHSQEKELEIEETKIEVPKIEPILLTEEDIELCKKVIPPSQYAFTLELTQGEEGEFFKGKLKEIAETYRQITSDGDLVNPDGTHNVGFHYFLGSTDFYISQIYTDGYAFGYAVLNGDVEMSEWGDISLDEVRNIPWLEVDYHVPKGTTIEEMLHKAYPKHFPEPKKELDTSMQVTEEEKPRLTFFVADNPEFDNESFTELSLEDAIKHYKELASEYEVSGIRFPCIGINIHDGSDYDSKDEVGSFIFNGKSLQLDLLDDIPYYKKNPQYITAIKQLAVALIENDINVENADEFFEKYKSEIIVNDIIYKSYYNSENAREICHALKQTDDLLKKENAIETVVDHFVKQNIFKSGDILVPIPQHTGNAEYTLSIANKIAEKTNTEVYDILKCKPHDTMYDQKKEEKESLEVEMFTTGTIPEGRRVFFIDNVISTGTTYNEAIKHIPNMIPLAYALTDNAKLSFDGQNYHVGKEPEKITPMNVYSFSPFGYEGAIVSIETDLRRGIPAVDIIGIADSQVKETRERVIAAFANSGLTFPQERVLISASPADLKKENPMDLAIATSILSHTENFMTEQCLVLGELELSGNIRPVRGGYAAAKSAVAHGITHILCDEKTAEEINKIPGIKIAIAKNLAEVPALLKSKENFISPEVQTQNNKNIRFNETLPSIDNSILDGHFETARALEIAAAGKHNFLLVGPPGCGKTLLSTTLIPALTPNMTEEESNVNYRIKSLAGLTGPHQDKYTAPFRMPHQTASIEGMCGGGVNCRPGEISLATNGTLFLDETAEFRTSVLQMLRVPLENKSVTLSRAGRSTVYPANFQLGLATNPCPCGNFHSESRICLCSAKSIEQYWNKFSAPLLDRVEIKHFVKKDTEDTRKITVDEMKSHVETAIKIQRERGVYNSKLNPLEIAELCKLNKTCQKYMDTITQKNDLSPRNVANILKVSLTIANMDGREKIRINDLKEANELCSNVFEKPNQYKYNFESSIENDENEVREPIRLYSAKYQNELSERKEQFKKISEELSLHQKWRAEYSEVEKQVPSWLGQLLVNDSNSYGKLLIEEKNFSDKIEKLETKIVNDSIQPSLFDDKELSALQLKESEKERESIIKPIISGDRTGLWKAFKEFEEHGVFDIKGKTLSLSKNNTLTKTSMKQLQAAMNIYRNKKFETFRYILVDKNSGKITDQLAISSHMPNASVVSVPNEETVKQVITRAEETDSLIVIAHNHPSGNVAPSNYDIETTKALEKIMTTTSGISRFAGHIILDHDKFCLYLPKKGWNEVETKVSEQAFEKEKPSWVKIEVNDNNDLKLIAKEINDTNNWNDDFIPVVFTNSGNKISGVQYFHKDFFLENQQDKIRNDILFSSLDAGAIGAFPIITDSCYNKMNKTEQTEFESKVKELISRNVFIDCALNNTTVTEKYFMEPGKFISRNIVAEKDKEIDVQATWKTRINPELFYKAPNQKTKDIDIER